MQTTATPGLGAALGPSTQGDELAALRLEIAALDTKVELMARQLRELEPLVAIAADAFDHHVARLRMQGVDVDARARVALALAEHLTRPDVLGLVETLCQPSAMTTASTLARSVASINLDEAQPVGLWGLWRATGDPDVQRGLGVVALLLRVLGRTAPRPPHERRALTSAKPGVGGAR